MRLPVVRSLLRDRSFSIISVLSLTLALGAIGAVLNIIDAVLLRTLPVEGPEDLLAIENVDASGAPRMFSYQMFRGVAENTKVFSSLFGWSEPILRVGEGPEFERVAAILATGDFAKTLNLRAWRGRFFTEVDDRSGSPLVVVVSYRFARRHFPAGDAALGATLTIEGAPFTVIGVAPQDFSGLQVGFSTDLLIPVSVAPLTLRDDSLMHSPSLLWLKILGRRKPEVSVDQVKASLAVLWPSVLESIAPSGRSAAWRKRFLSQRLRTVSAARGFSPLREQYELWLWGILTLTGLLAILAFMGVASQNLARALSRMQEMSIRLSLGATPARLVAPYGVEMFVLIAIAVSLSILGGYWGSKYLAAQVSLGPLPIYLNLVPTFRVIALTLVSGSLFGLLFGLLPLLVVTHFDLAMFLRISGDQDILGPGRWKCNRLLAAAQVTVLTPFLVTAFLLSSTLVALQRVDPGYRPGNVLLQRLEPRTEGYGQLNVATYYLGLLERVSSLPGVRSASLALTAPLERTNWEEIVSTRTAQGDASAFVNCVMPGFFETLGIPLLEGSDFGPEVSGRKSAVLSVSLANRLFPGENAVGRLIALGPKRGQDELQVIGVVRDVRMHDLRNDRSHDVYLSCLEHRELANSLTLVLRSGQDSSLIAGAVRDVVYSMGVELPVEARTLTALVNQNLAQERLLAILSGFFAGLALVVSSISIFGLNSYVATRRMREMGIRMALGARPAGIMWLQFREHLVFLIGGTATGAFAAVGIVRLVSSQLYGLSQAEVSVFTAGAAAFSFSLGAVAVVMSARRAAVADPAILLRHQ